MPTIITQAEQKSSHFKKTLTNSRANIA